MRSSIDRSHAANVANFEAMLTYLATLGTRYNPGPDKQKLTYLQSRLTSTKAIMIALTKAEEKDTITRNERRDLFETLPPLASRVVAIFGTCEVSEDTHENARAVLKLFQGKRLTKAKASETEGDEGAEHHEPAHHEASQKSFTYMVSHVEHLIEIISSAPDYLPNEIELKKTSLESLLADLNAANAATYTTGAALDKARLDRNRALYRDGDGIVKIAKKVKDYVVAVFGTKSEQAEKIRSFTFRDQDFSEVAETLPDPS